MYEYSCKILRVVDGDTVDVLIDLGLKIATAQRIRLWGINAPEIATPGGKQAREFLRGLSEMHEEWTIKTVKDKTEKYGRYLGTIFHVAEDSLNKQMVDTGHAVWYDGGKR